MLIVIHEVAYLCLIDRVSLLNPRRTYSARNPRHRDTLSNSDYPDFIYPSNQYHYNIT